MSTSDPVESFMEEVVLLPGWITRNLWLMRLLDQQGNEIESKLTDKKNKYLSMLRMYEEKQKRLRNGSTKRKDNNNLNKNVSIKIEDEKTEPEKQEKLDKKKKLKLEEIENSFENDVMSDSVYDEEPTEGSEKKILDEELHKILDMQKAVKNLLKEKIQTANQCIHFVRYEFEHLKKEYEKLQKDIRQSGGMDGGNEDLGGIGTRRQQNSRLGNVSGNVSSLVGGGSSSAGGINSVGGPIGAATGAACGRLVAETLTVLGEAGTDVNIESKGRSRVNSDIGGGGLVDRSSIRKNSGRESSMRYVALSREGGGGSDVTVGSADGGMSGVGSSGRACKRAKKSGNSMDSVSCLSRAATISDVQSNVGVGDLSSGNIRVGINQQPTVGGMTIRIASSRQQDDKLSNNQSIVGGCAIESGAGGSGSGRLSARHYQQRSIETDGSDNYIKKNLYGAGSGNLKSSLASINSSKLTQSQIRSYGGSRGLNSIMVGGNGDNSANLVDNGGIIDSFCIGLGKGESGIYGVGEVHSGNLNENMLINVGGGSGCLVSESINNNNNESESVCPICRDGEGVDADGNERPMVGCDACDEWFHFDCVNYVPPADEDEQSNFYCPPCINQGRVPISEVQKTSHKMNTNNIYPIYHHHSNIHHSNNVNNQSQCNISSGSISKSRKR